MNNLLEDVLCGAIGYAVGYKVSSASSDKPAPCIAHLNPIVRAYLEKTDISALIDDYAKCHGIYLRSNELSAALSRLADQYQEYNP